MEVKSRQAVAPLQFTAAIILATIGCGLAFMPLYIAIKTIWHDHGEGIYNPIHKQEFPRLRKIWRFSYGVIFISSSILGIIAASMVNAQVYGDTTQTDATLDTNAPRQALAIAAAAATYGAISGAIPGLFWFSTRKITDRYRVSETSTPALREPLLPVRPALP